jgi:hypothetical protein
VPGGGFCAELLGAVSLDQVRPRLVHQGSPAGLALFGFAFLASGGFFCGDALFFVDPLGLKEAFLDLAEEVGEAFLQRPGLAVRPPGEPLRPVAA